MRMARKYEFQPDKPYSNWLAKLQLTKLQQRQVLKWGLYALLMILLSVFQDVVLCRLRFFGGTTDLVPCCILAVCILQGAESGCVFALISSMIYCFSGSAPGIYTIPLITGIAVVTAIFRQAYLRKGFFTLMLCVAAALFAYETITFSIGLFLGQTLLVRYGAFVISTILTLLPVPALYPVLLYIGKIGGETWKD